MHTVKRSSLPLGTQGSVCSSPRLRGETLSSSGTTSTGALGLSPPAPVQLESADNVLGVTPSKLYKL